MIPNEISEDLFARGIVLGSAFYHFADKSKAALYKKNMYVAGGWVGIISQLAAAFNKPDFIPEDQRVPPAEIYAHRQLEAELKDKCRQWLLTGALVGYGYAQPRAPADPPRRVPRDVWALGTDWSAGKAQYNGLNFEAVRVFLPEWVKPAQALVTAPAVAAPAAARSVSNQSEPPPPEPRPMGRPSKRPIIEEAYRKCAEQNLLGGSTRRTDAIATIQKHIKKNFPTDWGKAGRGFGEEVIRQVISDHEDH